MARQQKKNGSNSNSNNKGSAANLGFEAKLRQAADKLRSTMDAAEYKHVVLGLIFLKYISDRFEQQRAKLVAGAGDYAGANAEDPDEYRAENVFWVPAEARWPALQADAKAERHRQKSRRRDGRDRARQPEPERRAAQRLRSPRARCAAAG